MEWTYEQIELAVINFITRETELKGISTFPIGADFRLRDSLPSTGTLKRITGMTPTEFFIFLYKEGKVPYKYEMKRITPRVYPRTPTGELDSAAVSSGIKTRLMRKDMIGGRR